MRNKFLTLLQDFTRIAITYLPVLILLRVIEYFTLGTVHNLPAGSSRFIFLGLLPDLVVFFLGCLIAIVPYFLIGLLNRKLSAYLWYSILILYSFFYFALVKYFATTLVPLDQVIFSYSVREMVTISSSSASFTFVTFLPFLIILAVAVLSFYLFRKMKPGLVPVSIVLGLMAASLFALRPMTPKPTSYEHDLEFFMAVNKPFYLADKCITYMHHGRKDINVPASADAEMLEQFAIYHTLHPGFTFVGPTYPLLHKDDSPDVLGDRFTFGKEPPNLVFIIVESLSSAFCGDKPFLGSFTPFLDSLAQKGLYWKNCLSTSERTFYVLPAMFASLPYGSGVYLDNLTRSAYNLSLIRYLGNSGYTSRFFYGGDPSFNQMDNFLNRNNTTYLLTTWGPGYNVQAKAESGFKWGYPDHEMFRRSFEVMDSMRSGPCLDIYLTLSMHAPFIPPMAEKYRERFDKRLMELNLNESQRNYAGKYNDIYTTILYTDDALRNFFREYSRRPEYANTIFFITGDHSLPELNLGWYSPMERFRVPFIIWSPMLKEPHEFSSVITHLDVTPTVLAMLKDRFGIGTNSLSHWLGNSFDTSSAYRCERSLVCIRNNKEMVDFVDGNNCLSDGRLYRMRPDMSAVRVEDPLTAERLQQKLDNFVKVTQYVGAANILIPIWMMFGNNLSESEVPIRDSLAYDPSGYMTDGFISIIKKRQVENIIKYLTVSIRFEMRSPETDPEKLPKLVFEASGPTGNSLLWNQYPLSFLEPYKPGQWNTVAFTQSMDMSYAGRQGACNLKMYLWNTNNIMISLDSLQREIKAYK